jgi:G3E family GTPase
LNKDFHANIIRSKGLFWLASRPNDALNWSQAGGSLRAEKAGVWWASMPFSQRIKYASFVEFQQSIEARWDKELGDRMTELVFIGQDLDKELITAELRQCLCTEGEIKAIFRGFPFKDPFPC